MRYALSRVGSLHGYHAEQLTGSEQPTVRSKSLWRKSIERLSGIKYSSSAAPRLSCEEVLERNRIAMPGVVRTVDKDHSATLCLRLCRIHS